MPDSPGSRLVRSPGWIAAAIGLGILWNVVAVRLMGGRISDALTIGWLVAGALAGCRRGRARVRERPFC